MRDHILTETIAKDNGIFEHCMYCGHNLNNEWHIQRNWFSNYIFIICNNCHHSHSFKDETISTIEELLEKLQ